ncbi:hypothetical protein [Spirosoma linguale]|uniref:PKD domain containing protein n=1 Tax=Spirosoma linguale (strain ATCC 33905 / DSM 74 / LMG 10896 / Claus 1) TaxID=504472 RepID=D2QGC9_SPILD|nr:PKD domain containing protein [Spirosoma linguale DSM 74]
MKTSFPISFVILCIITVACHKDVQPRPTADFTYSVYSSSNVEKVFQFTNTSKNADRYQWLTPTGLASSDKDIKVRVTENARINVSLTAKNDVGEDTKTESIDVAGLATTGNFIFFTSVPDKGDISIYVNSILQGKITKYYSSGSPSCGEQGSVTVTLPPATYPYTAKSEGLFPYNWSGTFTVVRGSCNSIRLTK